MESDQKNYSREGMKQDHPGNINPDEVNRQPPSNAISEMNHLDINQSELGREQGQKPADEHIDNSFSQIDQQTTQQYDSSMEQTLAKELDTEDFKRVDERDNADSTEEWDSEKSRTGRNK